MTTQKLTKVVVGEDGVPLNFSGEADVGAIGGKNASVKVGMVGVAYAGAGGIAEVGPYSIAIVAGSGQAIGGSGSVVCAYERGSARGGDFATVWARRNGTADVGRFGLASAQDANATGGRASVAMVLRRGSAGATATASSEGIAVVRSHESLSTGSRPAIAYSNTGGIAVAFDGNSVKGDVGALLVASYKNDGQIRFAVGVVDNVTLMANQTYACDTNGAFVAV